MSILLTALGCLALLSLVPAIVLFSTQSWRQTWVATAEYLTVVGITVGVGAVLGVAASVIEYFLV